MSFVHELSGEALDPDPEAQDDAQSINSPAFENARGIAAVEAHPESFPDRGNNLTKRTFGDGQDDSGLSSVLIDQGAFIYEEPLTSAPLLHGSSSLSPSSSRSQVSLYVDTTEVKLINQTGAALLHYFKAHVGYIWFDATDPAFTTEALRLAPICPLLLYSMLATASAHKRHFTAEALVAQRYAADAQAYHEECVRLLLTMLDEKESVKDPAFMACSTILRFYEEITAPVHGQEDARHLLGGYASVAESQGEAQQPHSLGDAAFWLHVRQDTYAAIINARSPKIDLLGANLELSNSPEDGVAWAKQATRLHCGVVEFCFGSGPTAGSVQQFHILKQMLAD